MSQLIRIDASSTPQSSHSTALADYFQTHWQDQSRNPDLIQHSLIELNLPHIDEAFIEAMYTPAEQRSDEQKQILKQSDQLVTELKQASTLLISTPMYNFTIPSQLKAYLDHITRVGETFRYGDNGPEGLLNIKQVVVIVASGGNYTQPPLDAMNFVTPYLKTILGFNGLNQITVIEAPSMAGSEERRLASLESAQQQIKALFSS